MKARALVLYWLVLLAATLAAGAWMLRLLQSEQQRIEATGQAALQQKARSLAENLVLIVEEAKDGLLAGLQSAPPDQRPALLEELERGNPIVRNTFVWSRDAGLVDPDPSTGMSDEQRGFVQRYQRLFSGAQSWPEPSAAERSDYAVASRLEVRKLAQASAPQDDTAHGDRGWLPWFWEDQIYLLGWIRSSDGATRHGLELEMPALLSRLAISLPSPPAGQAYALLDGNGRVFAQRGGAEVTPETKVSASAGLGPTLPHWTLVIHETAGGGAARDALKVTAASMAAVLMLAILSAGSLLLWQARHSLREARRKTTFVSNVSHELKTPLTTIRMYAEMLSDGRVADEHKRAHYLDVITRESQRLTRLVNNVLDFSRLEQGRKHYTRESIDLVSAFRTLLEGQADRVRESGMGLDVSLPPGPAWAACDRDALEQAALNLLDNAVKYAADGKRLAVSLTRAGARWRLSVEDAGPGVAPAHRGRLFEQFHRVDESPTAKVAGFGLGLSISRRLIEDQGGALTYETASGGGARFVIELPAAPESPS